MSTPSPLSRRRHFIFDFREKNDSAPPPSKILMAPVFGAIVGSTFLAVYWPATLRLGGGAALRGIAWSTAGLVWLWALVWYAIVEVTKVAMYRLNSKRGYESLFYGPLLEEELSPRPRSRANANGQSFFRGTQFRLLAKGRIRAVADEQDNMVVLPELLQPLPAVDGLLEYVMKLRDHVVSLEDRLAKLDGKEIHFKSD